MAGLIKGFVDRTLELKDQKATAASKAAKLAREQAKNLQTNLLKLYTPKSLSETQNYEGAKTALLNAGVNPLLIDASIQGAKSLSSTAEKKKTFDQTKSFLDQVKEGKIPAPNMANLLYALENPKSSPKSKKNALNVMVLVKFLKIRNLVHLMIKDLLLICVLIVMVMDIYGRIEL